MEVIKLKARLREGEGKSYTRKARASGWIPAIYYGKKIKPLKIEVDHHDFETIVRKKKLTHLIDLELPIEDSDSISIIKEIQRNVIKDNLFYHIDFQHVNMKEKIVVDCPVHLEGIPVGVKEDGGVLGHPVKTLSIECLPTEIPEKIVVDVSNLHLGESIHVRDLSIPNITIKDSPDEVVAVVTHATKEVVVEKTEAVEGEAAAEATSMEGSSGKTDTEQKGQNKPEQKK